MGYPLTGSFHPVVQGAPPPEPVINHTGNVPIDAFAQVINETAAPFQQAPPSNPVVAAAHYAQAVMGVIGMADRLQEVGVAAVFAPLNAIMPPIPVMHLGSFSMGMPHVHQHPPSFIPPAPPVPLPSMGMVMLPGALSVLVGGIPIARAGDVGITITCGTLGPPFEIALGSSNVFAGGSRVARIGEDIDFHDNPAPLSALELVMAITQAAVSYTTAAAQVIQDSPGAAAATIAQQTADAAAMAIKMLRYVDCGGPPDIGAILVGCFTVVAGGFPVPPAHASAHVLHGLAGLARGVIRRLPARVRAYVGSEGPGAHASPRSQCGHEDCP